MKGLFERENKLYVRKVLALKWSDLDLRRGTASVQRALVRNRKGADGRFNLRRPRGRDAPFHFLCIWRNNLIPTREYRTKNG